MYLLKCCDHQLIVVKTINVTPDFIPQKKDGELDPNMNPLSKVNHLFPGLITWAFESSGPAHCPVFNATASVQGKAYSSSGEKMSQRHSFIHIQLSIILLI